MKTTMPGPLHAVRCKLSQIPNYHGTTLVRKSSSINDYHGSFCYHDLFVSLQRRFGHSALGGLALSGYRGISDVDPVVVAFCDLRWRCGMTGLQS